MEIRQCTSSTVACWRNRSVVISTALPGICAACDQADLLITLLIAAGQKPIVAVTVLLLSIFVHSIWVFAAMASLHLLLRGLPGLAYRRTYSPSGQHGGTYVNESAVLHTLEHCSAEVAITLLPLNVARQSCCCTDTAYLLTRALQELGSRISSAAASPFNGSVGFFGYNSSSGQENLEDIDEVCTQVVKSKAFSQYPSGKEEEAKSTILANWQHNIQKCDSKHWLTLTYQTWFGFQA